SGLKPASRYHIVCLSDGEESRELHFVTAPDEDVPLSILFGGDSRSGLEDRKKVNGMMARMVDEQIASGRPAILAFAHGGDFIVDGRNLGQWLQWLSDHEITTTGDGRLLPIVPTRGNHDLGPIFDQVFDFPEGDGNYYTTDLSPEVRLTTLNTEISTAGDQREWLAEELLADRWNRRWYLCQYHKPAFPAVKVPSGALTSWVPLFEQYLVDLVCEADGHNIKRTPPIMGHKVDPSGVVYIGEGGLGVGQRTPKTNRWFLQATADKCGSGHHVHLITFSRERIDCRVVLLNGELFDEFALNPRDPPNRAAALGESELETAVQ
ncbi:MAG: metallophosphoesterase family protein, partial [Aeoliella sp.]